MLRLCEHIQGFVPQQLSEVMNLVGVNTSHLNNRRQIERGNMYVDKGVQMPMHTNFENNNSLLSYLASNEGLEFFSR